jgi:arylsulfatase A-like enzyme/Flp pilus assembly protein TadD
MMLCGLCKNSQCARPAAEHLTHLLGTLKAEQRPVKFLGSPVSFRLFQLAIWATLIGSQPGWTQNPANPQWNIVLISIDTLRADHVGAYSHTSSVTPVLDRLAHEGVLFEEVFTSVPLTLPAHTSLFTSAYPSTNGVHDNEEALAFSVPTLAEQVRAHGIRTAAFIGAFVLDRRFGLARGFDEYWEEFSLHRLTGDDPSDIEIRGDKVERAAAEWIASHSSHPFLAFVHFYDLHGPYLLPDSWKARFPGRLYDGELAFVDNLIGQLWEHLKKEGLAERTVLVITSDHGEGLGDHGEQNHGFFLYRSTTHVPLIIRFPERRYAGKRIGTIARLIDVAPTICSLLEVASPPTFQGRSLMPEITDHGGKPRPPLPAYSETLYPYRYFHAAPLYSLRNENLVFIEAPRSELYDWRKDPAELHNLIKEKLAIASVMRGQLDALGASEHGPSAAPLTPELLEKLKSLGYVGAASSSSVPRQGSSLPDPKDRISDYRQFQSAIELQSRGYARAAAERLEAIAAREPALIMVEIEAGLTRQRLHEDQIAVNHFNTALRVDPENALAHYDLAISLGNLHRDQEAERELELTLTLQPWFSRAATALGLAQARQGKLREALASFDRALAVDPNDFAALLNRGNVEFIMREWDKGRRDLDRAGALEPDSAEVHEALGTMWFYKGNLDAALQEYLHALRLAPLSSSAHSDLGLLYRKLGREGDALAELRRALDLDPNNREAQEGLRNAVPNP